MDRVRVVLCLKAYGGVPEMVRRVELHAWLGRSHFHDAAALWLAQPRRHLQVLAFAENIVVVVAVQLWLQLLDALADAGRLAEVHRRVLERRDLSGGYQSSVGWSVGFGWNP